MKNNWINSEIGSRTKLSPVLSMRCWWKKSQLLYFRFFFVLLGELVKFASHHSNCLVGGEKKVFGNMWAKVNLQEPLWDSVHKCREPGASTEGHFWALISCSNNLFDYLAGDVFNLHSCLKPIWMLPLWGRMKNCRSAWCKWTKRGGCSDTVKWSQWKYDKQLIKYW